jgi:hypothetical protein
MCPWCAQEREKGAVNSGADEEGSADSKEGVKKEEKMNGGGDGEGCGGGGGDGGGGESVKGEMITTLPLAAPKSSFRFLDGPKANKNEDEAGVEKDGQGDGTKSADKQTNGHGYHG